MAKELVTVTLCRETGDEPWGFRLAGGKDHGQPLSISSVATSSLAAKLGLNADDYLARIDGKDTYDMTHEQAERAVQAAGNSFQMLIERETDRERKISYEKSAVKFALKLGGEGPIVEKKVEAFISNVPVSDDTPSLLDDDSVNFKKYDKPEADVSQSQTLKDMSKPHLRKDWNCPWVRKDGKGLKQAIRALDGPNCPVKTSMQHFYSEPRSILTPEPTLTKEELAKVIAEQGCDSRPDSKMDMLLMHSESRSRPDSRQGHDFRGQMDSKEQWQQQQQQQFQQFNGNQSHSVETTETHAVRMQEERVETRRRQEEESYGREREDDSQAPPPLETVEQDIQQLREAGYISENGMGAFDEEGYEPSADELIDVLKNLENLAAANPALYKAIVEQIKVNQPDDYEEQQPHVDVGYYQNDDEQLTNGAAAEYEQQMFEQEQMFQQQQELEQQQALYQQQQRVVQQHEEQQRSVHHEETSISYQQQEQKVEPKSAKLIQMEKEAEQEVREVMAAQRQAKMNKLHPPEPPKPKEISVIAGDGKRVTITLGQMDQEDSRKQIAMAAGLKHITLPNNDLNYGDDAAFSGSLRHVNREHINDGRKETVDGNPAWTGSLRHVKEKPLKHKKKEEADDVYGDAPWMGTLRHVVHDNQVTKNFGVNQFQSKRYPDEDAGNPYEARGGMHARPAFPLTPAAVINGCALTRDQMARKQEDAEVSRIRNNIRQSQTVSSALLKVLMPKLLKEHESKHPPMERDEAEKIMEEILAMQIGLNTEQQAEGSEEAELIIRAIMQDEVDKSIYSKMADDLEAASQRRKKEMKKKKKVKKVKGKEEAPVQTAA